MKGSKARPHFHPLASPNAEIYSSREQEPAPGTNLATSADLKGHVGTHGCRSGPGPKQDRDRRPTRTVHQPEDVPAAGPELHANTAVHASRSWTEAGGRSWLGDDESILKSQNPGNGWTGCERGWLGRAVEARGLQLPGRRPTVEPDRELKRSKRTSRLQLA